MKMRDYRLYLKDILAAVESIQAFTHGMNFETFQADDKTVSAVTFAAESALSGRWPGSFSNW
jgi:uncharacterized protein with HEPN domain